MKLRIQTDYALRTLMYLGYTGQTARSEDIATKFVISKDHLVKVIQLLAKHGYVRTTPGRGGGVSLALPAEQIALREVVERFEGRNGLLECVENPEVCPLEPGCRLRRALIRAERAFYDALSEFTIADLCTRRQQGGLRNLPFDT
ncbi:HTH-type transcriptional repressor NsrR [Botrimarina colliarenosi]|uniref:HTH-type transcriptional repressor NsrR n=1 Tax=Botrimarina colliarenosi TaxID=2528001 RepID=A0A5C6AGC6_9BACT|nr:Rrf2 family transcriptional regulator [Botrimarina colliarenosi]TWT99092.1 HTH-type transcriptional repressor NsrR [Botrimarina colliarenosi]